MAGHHEDLKRAIRAARSQADIKSDQELALRAGVHLQTIQNWFGGKTTPRPSELSKVAKALDMSMADLMAVYEGRDPAPQPLQDAIRDLTVEIHELIERLDTLASVAVASGVRDGLREAGLDPDAGASPSSRPDGLTA